MKDIQQLRDRLLAAVATASVSHETREGSEAQLARLLEAIELDDQQALVEVFEEHPTDVAAVTLITDDAENEVPLLPFCCAQEAWECARLLAACFASLPAGEQCIFAASQWLLDAVAGPVETRIHAGVAAAGMLAISCGWAGAHLLRLPKRQYFFPLCPITRPDIACAVLNEFAQVPVCEMDGRRTPLAAMAAAIGRRDLAAFDATLETLVRRRYFDGNQVVYMTSDELHFFFHACFACRFFPPLLSIATFLLTLPASRAARAMRVESLFDELSFNFGLAGLPQDEQVALDTELQKLFDRWPDARASFWARRAALDPRFGELASGACNRAFAREERAEIRAVAGLSSASASQPRALRI